MLVVMLVFLVIVFVRVAVAMLMLMLMCHIFAIFISFTPPLTPPLHREGELVVSPLGGEPLLFPPPLRGEGIGEGFVSGCKGTDSFLQLGCKEQLLVLALS